MKTLLILRHAKSSWKSPGLTDHDRPLNKRGRGDAPRMGALLAKEGLVPDRILCSTAKRARKTAEAVAESSGYAAGIELTAHFYHAGPEAYLRSLKALAEGVGCAMVVGHNPGLEQLLAVLTGEEEFLPTAALARVALPVERWRDLDGETAGELVSLWVPRELG